jgi:glycosyltransferase involved in cell wall biosynthesis
MSLATSKPEWQFVMIGETAAQSHPLRASNLHWLGPRRHEDIPSYAASWAAAIVPFRTDVMQHVGGAKVLEFLAAGLPVVATPIHDVVHPFGRRGIVRIADCATFVPALEDAIRGGPSARQRRAEECVRDMSWDATWSHAAALVDAAVASKRRRH